MEAMQKALSTEEAVASAWRPLAQDTEEQFGFLLFLPVYKSGMPLQNIRGASGKPARLYNGHFA